MVLREKLGDDDAHTDCKTQKNQVMVLREKLGDEDAYMSYRQTGDCIYLQGKTLYPKPYMWQAADLDSDPTEDADTLPDLYSQSDGATI